MDIKIEPWTMQLKLRKNLKGILNTLYIYYLFIYKICPNEIFV